MTMAAIEFEAEPVFAHVSVMPGEVVEALDPARGGVFVDATAGGAGHSAALLTASPELRLIACDRDPLAVRTRSRGWRSSANARCACTLRSIRSRSAWRPWASHKSTDFG